MSHINKTISIGNIVTILVLLGGFAAQWGAFSSRLAAHEEKLDAHDRLLMTLKGIADASYPASAAHQEQRASDAKLSDISTRVVRIEESLLNIKASLARIEGRQ